MKKLSVYLIILFSFFENYVFAQQIQTGNLQLVSKNDFLQSRKLSPVALKAIRQGLKPASFKNVTYSFKPNVVILDKYKTNEIAQKITGPGIILKKSFQQTGLDSHKIYISKEAQVAFKPVPFGRDTLILKKPELKEVLTDFKIPEQSVQFNLANTTYTPENTEVSDEETPDGGYLLKMEFKDTLYHFHKVIEKGYTKTTIDIDVNLDGHLYLKNPVVTARYTSRKGYKFKVILEEDADITAKAQVDIASEISFPVWAFDIPAGDYGSCRIGIYAFLDMSGKIKLVYKIEQSLKVEAGIKGKTFFYYPRSYHPFYTIEKSFNSDYEIYGEFKAFGGVEVTGDIKVLKHNLVKLDAKAGPEFEVKTIHNGKDYAAKLGARLKITAKLTKGKNYNIYDKYYLLWERTETNYGGFAIDIRSADAYNDRVWGRIYNKQDSTAYTGELLLKVKHADNTETVYRTNTDEEGIFAIDRVPLVKGDLVMAKPAPSPNYCPPVESTIPFKEIKLHYADYFTNQVQGTISSKIDGFPKDKIIHQPAQNNFNIQAVRNITKTVAKTPGNIVKLPVKISQKQFENAIIYKGDVEVITRPSILQLSKKKMYNPLGVKKNKSSIQAEKNIKNFARLKKRVVNLPFGVFGVSGVDIKPFDWVKVRINIDGFILESKEIFADGLVFTPTVDVNKSGTILTETIRADDSYTVINALRTDKIPTGKVKMIKGIDMKHTKVPNILPNQTYHFPHLEEFPQAKRPLIYYNKYVTLKPSDVQGFAEAHTGPWQVKNIFYSKTNIGKRNLDGHRFEYIGYNYDNKWIGYKYYQKKCLLEKDALNKVSKDNVGPSYENIIKNIFH